MPDAVDTRVKHSLIHPNDEFPEGIQFGTLPEVMAGIQITDDEVIRPAALWRHDSLRFGQSCAGPPIYARYGEPPLESDGHRDQYEAVELSLG